MLFGFKGGHSISNMQALQRLRQDGSLCDACLVVGDQRIQAHRCILVAGSEYFRARFIGPMKERDDKPDVDLSIVARDVVYVEKVIDFLYEGVIDIDQSNVGPFLKLASFLLISQLRKYCIRFMEETVDRHLIQVDTIVKYYLLAADFMVPDIENKLKNTVMTRFHDWLIFDESTLQVSPDQLRFLIKTCNIFEFCSEVDILKFIFEWVKAGKSEAYDVLRCELLDVFCKKANGNNANETRYGELKNVLEKLTAYTKDKNQDSDFMAYQRKVLDTFMINYPKADVNELKCIVKQASASSDLSNFSDSDLDQEPMVLTISPKSCLKRELVKRSSTRPGPGKIHEITLGNSKAIFDICAYVPRTKTWYHLKEGQYNGLFRNIVSEELCWYFCGMFDTINCLPLDSPDKLHFLSLRDYSSQSISDTEVTLRLGPNENACDNICIIGDNKDVYLVSVITYISADGQPNHFRCYKLTPKNTWAFVFSSPTFEDISSDDGMLCGAFSSVSNEMILIYFDTTPISDPEERADETSDDDSTSMSDPETQANETSDDDPCKLVVFVATFGTGKSSQVKVLRLSAEFNKSRYWQILQDENQFFILGIDYIDAGFRLAYRYKYIYHSNILTPINSNEEIVGDVSMSCDMHKSCHLMYKTDSGDGRSMWMYSGNELNASNLTEASVENNGNMVVKAHKPPPFSCVTALMAGNIDVGCLTGATPVARYLND